MPPRWGSEVEADRGPRVCTMGYYLPPHSGRRQDPHSERSRPPYRADTGPPAHPSQGLHPAIPEATWLRLSPTQWLSDSTRATGPKNRLRRGVFRGWVVRSAPTSREVSRLSRGREEEPHEDRNLASQGLARWREATSTSLAHPSCACHRPLLSTPAAVWGRAVGLNHASARPLTGFKSTSCTDLHHR